MQQTYTQGYKIITNIYKFQLKPSNASKQVSYTFCLNEPK